MVEIGAGGGSIAKVDDMKRISVGPESSGASPGPACYGQGGLDATVTDADVILGRIDLKDFAGGAVKLAPEKADLVLQRRLAINYPWIVLFQLLGFRKLSMKTWRTLLEFTLSNGEKI